MTNKPIEMDDAIDKIPKQRKKQDEMITSTIGVIDK